MRPPAPELRHSQEIYQAIIVEHAGQAERMGERLQQFGWSLADAAWVIVHWPFLWLAAAIAHERETRNLRLHGLLPPPK